MKKCRETNSWDIGFTLDTTAACLGNFLVVSRSDNYFLKSVYAFFKAVNWLHHEAMISTSKALDFDVFVDEFDAHHCNRKLTFHRR
jgi:hypothetical protein